MNTRCITARFTAFAALAIAAPPAVAAQQGMPGRPAFQQVIRLAQDGYGDSARTLISRIIDRTSTTDS